jgi:hypothetical protein
MNTMPVMVMPRPFRRLSCHPLPDACYTIRR